MPGGRKAGWFGIAALYAGLVGWLAWASMIRERWAILTCLVAGSMLLLLFFYYRAPFGSRFIVLAAIVFRLAFAPLQPSLSDDAYRYVWDGQLTARGINPFAYTPEDPALTAYQSSPVYEPLNSKEYFSVYPPVSQFIFGAAGLISQQNTDIHFYLIKAILMLFEIGGLLLLARLVAPHFLILYAWHPLVLIETAGQAHTESAMLFFLVAAVAYVRRNKGGWATLMLTLAGWVKLYPLVLLPFLWRRYGWKIIGIAGLTSLAVWIPFYHPQLISNMRSSLDLYAQLFEFNAGPYYLAKQFYYWAYELDWSKQLGPMMRNWFLFALPVLYVLDFRFKWPASHAFIITLGLFFALSTTVHPWYLLGVVLLAVLSEQKAWHWFWLAAVSIGTYALYVEGPYWFFVIVGWGGWAIGLIWYRRRLPFAMLLELQRLRGEQKARRIMPLLPARLPTKRILDLGAGEGFVGASLHRRTDARVQLADVIDLNATAVPLTLYDGKQLPFPDNHFDVTVLYFVLHHCEDPEAVYREALRVTSGRVVIAESVYDTPFDLRVLTFLDTLANRVRSLGRMKGQEQHLHFRKADEWHAFFDAHGGWVGGRMQRGFFPHKQAYYWVAQP